MSPVSATQAAHDARELNARIAAAIASGAALASGAHGIRLDAGRTWDLDRAVDVFGPGFGAFCVDLNGGTIRRSIPAATKAVALFHARALAAVGLVNGHLVGKKDPAQGYLAAVEGHHGVILSAVESAVLADLTIENVPGDFVYMTSMGGGGPRKPPATPCGTVQLDNVHANEAGRHALTGIAVEEVRVGEHQRCTFTNYRRKKFDREPTSRFHSPPLAYDNPANLWLPYRKPAKRTRP